VLRVCWRGGKREEIRWRRKKEDRDEWLAGWVEQIGKIEIRKREGTRLVGDI
jgi:hypothetical protein